MQINKEKNQLVYYKSIKRNVFIYNFLNTKALLLDFLITLQIKRK